MQHKVEPGSFLLSPAPPHCLEGGQGQALEPQLITGDRSLSLPARQTARTKDVAVIHQET